jgi:hypothetical protein
MTTTPVQLSPNLRESHPEVLISDLVREIERLPRDSWVALLTLIRLFGANLGQATQSPEEQWVQALELARVPSAERSQALGELLRSWVEEGDGPEQRETWDFLHQALDADRLSSRPLFP